MNHYASADQVHLNQGTIYRSPPSHFPPCQAAGDAGGLHTAVVLVAAAAVVVAGGCGAAAGLDTVQNFVPTPAFLQLSARPATIMAGHIK